MNFLIILSSCFRIKMDYWLGAEGASPAPTLRKVISNPLKQFKNPQKKLLKNMRITLPGDACKWI